MSDERGRAWLAVEVGTKVRSYQEGVDNLDDAFVVIDEGRAGMREREAVSAALGSVVEPSPAKNEKALRDFLAACEGIAPFNGPEVNSAYYRAREVACAALATEGEDANG